jgi:hypothetical protein
MEITTEADEKLGHGLKQTQKCGGATLDIYCQCEHQKSEKNAKNR